MGVRATEAMLAETMFMMIIISSSSSGSSSSIIVLIIIIISSSSSNIIVTIIISISIGQISAHGPHGYVGASARVAPPRRYGYFLTGASLVVQPVRLHPHTRVRFSGVYRHVRGRLAYPPHGTPPNRSGDVKT